MQDRHIKSYGDTEPVVDPSQDYILMLGYENSTHTVLRFRRKLDTCDTAHDIPITVSSIYEIPNEQLGIKKQERKKNI